MHRLGRIVQQNPPKRSMSCMWGYQVWWQLMDWIKNRVHLNSTLDYQPIGGLIELVRRKTDQIEQMHLTKLNDNRKLETHAASLADHKQWILAIASGRVECVSSLVQAGLKQELALRASLHSMNRLQWSCTNPRATPMKTSYSWLWCSIWAARILPNSHTGQHFSQVQLLLDKMLSPYHWKFLLGSQQSLMQRKIYLFLLDPLKALIRMAAKLNTRFSFLMRLPLRNGLDGMIEQICFWVCVGNMATRSHWNSSLRKSWTFSVMPLIMVISMPPVRYILWVLKVGTIFTPFYFRQQLVPFAHYQKMLRKQLFVLMSSQELVRRKLVWNTPNLSEWSFERWKNISK